MLGFKLRSLILKTIEYMKSQFGELGQNKKSKITTLLASVLFLAILFTVYNLFALKKHDSETNKNNIAIDNEIELEKSEIDNVVDSAKNIRKKLPLLEEAGRGNESEGEKVVSSLGFSTNGNVRILVTNPQKNRTGMNYDGTIFTEIPNSSAGFMVGMDEDYHGGVGTSNPIDGDYFVSVFGDNDLGDFSLNVQYVNFEERSFVEEFGLDGVYSKQPFYFTVKLQSQAEGSDVIQFFPGGTDVDRGIQYGFLSPTELRANLCGSLTCLSWSSQEKVDHFNVYSTKDTYFAKYTKIAEVPGKDITFNTGDEWSGKKELLELGADTKQMVYAISAVNKYGTESLLSNVTTNSDRDYDFLSDEDEKEYGTDPTLFDTDGDGLNDNQEVYEFETDPLLPDTDGDGIGDYDEIKEILGKDPKELWDE